MKVLLLQPLVTKEKMWGKYAVSGGFVPPIGLVCIAGYLEKKNYPVKIIDPLVDRLDNKHLGKILKAEKYDLIGIPAFTNTVVDTYRTVNFCKKLSPKSKIVVGGFHATVLPVQTMEECPNIDFLVAGEGEIVVEELLKYLEKGTPVLEKIKGLVFRNKTGRIITNKKGRLIDIDRLPMPAYHLVKMEKYIPHPTQYRVLPNYPVITQRGCPFNCAFCSAHCVHGRVVRPKSIPNLIKELEILINDYGTKGIYFQDSTFADPPTLVLF